jgi:hypothetical protein
MMPSGLDPKEIIAGLPTPFLDLVRASSGPRSSLSECCPFPVVVDSRVPDPEMIYVSRGFEVEVTLRRITVTHHLEPVIKLEVV